jgi:hypothetical protein
MDLRKIKTLIELVENSGIAELEIKEGEEFVRISRTSSAPLLRFNMCMLRRNSMRLPQLLLLQRLRQPYLPRRKAMSSNRLWWAVFTVHLLPVPSHLWILASQ